MLGAAGFVAPRHMRAIRDTGHELVAAMDPNDSVGILDTHFPDCAFFTDINEFTDFIKASINRIIEISKQGLTALSNALGFDLDVQDSLLNNNQLRL